MSFNTKSNENTGGGISGVLYSLILFLIGSLFLEGISFSPVSAALFAISLLGGAFGGILGINSVRIASAFALINQKFALCKFFDLKRMEF